MSWEYFDKGAREPTCSEHLMRATRVEYLQGPCTMHIGLPPSKQAPPPPVMAIVEMLGLRGKTASVKKSYQFNQLSTVYSIDSGAISKNELFYY